MFFGAEKSVPYGDDPLGAAKIFYGDCVWAERVAKRITHLRRLLSHRSRFFLFADNGGEAS
ncbi:hypothetical protein B4168_3831 [Anoxybacillus flavithermus]|nr:hypothetical protein B4168_3831 [Anoxybacillus flavithermus]